MQTSIVQNYLELLDGLDTPYIWQLLPEGLEEGSAKVKYGTFADLSSYLEEQNNLGYGIFITVNQSSTRKRKAEDISNVRALFVELDHGELTDANIMTLVNKFDISWAVNSSAGKYHLYWKVDKDLIATNKFSAIQSLLQYLFRELDAGRESKDLPRVLRVPGFFHNKKEPYLSRLIEGTGSVVTNIELFFGLMGIDEELIDAAKNDGFFGLVNAAEKFKNNEAVSGDSYVGASAGGRNDAMFNFIFHNYFSKKGLSVEEAVVLASMANKKNNPPLTDDELITLVTSAYRRFIDQGASSVADRRAAVEAVIQAPNEEPIIDEAFGYDYSLPEMFPPNSQLSISSRIEQRFCDRIRFNNERGFYYLEDGVWRNSREIDGLMINLITQVTNLLDSEPVFRDCFVDDNMRFKRSNMRSYLKEIHSSNYLTGIKKLLSTRPALYASASEFETPSDAHLFACSNEVVDLATGLPATARQKKNSRLVYRSNVKYDPQAKCEKWEHFLSSCMEGDQESVEYIQKVCGYLLSGDTSLKSMFLVYGIPGTGKSIFLNVLSAVMSEYATELPPSAFLDKGQDTVALSALGQAQYCRMCTVMEVDSKDKWGKSIVKALTGDDYVTAKVLYKDSFKYKPRFKLCIRANEMPHTDSLDQAIWERLKFLSFNVKFRGTNLEDTELESKLMTELSGIINWASVGYQKLQATGLTPSPRFLAETRIIRNDSNNIDYFIDESLVKGGSKALKFSDFMKSYTAWCRVNDSNAVSLYKVKKYLQHKGILVLDDTGKNYWIPNSYIIEEYRVVNGNAIFEMI